MSKTTIFCRLCGFSAPRRKGGRIGKHYVYVAGTRYLCMGSGKLPADIVLRVGGNLVGKGVV